MDVIAELLQAWVGRACAGALPALAATQPEEVPAYHAESAIGLLQFLGLVCGLVIVVFVIYQVGLKPIIERKRREWRHRRGHH